MGFYFGPHHLIMVALLYFEEKVHRKKLHRADTIPLLFLRLLCHILEHMGYPTEPHLERHHHCRNHFTLDQWTQLAERNSAESTPEAALPRPVPPIPAQPDQAQQDKHPTETIPSTPTAPSMPQITSTDPPATPPVPPVAHFLSQDFITIFGSKFHGMVLLFRTLNATHNALFQKMRDIQAQQDRHFIILDQHTAILSQIQQHLGLAPPQTDIPGPSELRAPAKETIPAEETITTDVPPQATHETAPQPSCPPENPVP